MTEEKNEDVQAPKRRRTRQRKAQGEDAAAPQAAGPKQTGAPKQSEDAPQPKRRRTRHTVSTDAFSLSHFAFLALKSSRSSAISFCSSSKRSTDK